MVDPSANTQLMGLYRSGATYCTQCEAEGFRRITYFPDRPDVMAVYTTRIEADKAEARCCSPTAISSASGDVPGTSRHFAVWHDPFPKPSYLFALVGGDARLRRGHASAPCRAATSTLRIYVEPGKEDRCGYAMDSLKRSMRWDEEAFGREYDLDIFMIVAVSDFNMGAMENKGLNVFNDKYVLASPETATDADFERHRGDHRARVFPQLDRQPHHLPRLVPALPQGRAHGLPRPGIHRRPALARGRAHQRRARLARASVRRGCRPARPSGAARALSRDQQFLHGDGLREGRRGRAHAQDAARPGRTSARAWTSISTATTARPRPSSSSCNASPTLRGVDLAQFMLWYSQAGTPEVVVHRQLRCARQDLPLDVAQTVPPTPGQPIKEPMVIPLAIGLVGRDGRDLPLKLAGGRSDRARRPDLDASRPRVFVFADIAEPPVPVAQPRLLRADQAHRQPVGRRSALPRRARHRSVQSLAGAADARDPPAGRQCGGDRASGGAPREDQGLIEALAAVLADGALEPAFVALVLTLPGEADIAREIGRDVDPDAIFAARTALRAAIGEQLARPLLRHYRRLSQTPAPTGPMPRAPAAARCAIPASTSWWRRGSADAIALAARQYQAADNMTDRMAALATLVAVRRAGARGGARRISTRAMPAIR